MASRYTLNPGFLVVEDIHRSGCMSYRRSEESQERKDERLEADWRTHKSVADVDEQQALGRECDRVLASVRNLGFATKAGVFVPVKQADVLERALLATEGMIRDYNASAKFTSITGGFLVFAILPSDVRVAKSIMRKVRLTLGEVKAAVAKTDIKEIRAALGRVRRMDAMLAEDEAVALQGAFKEARRIARQITRIAEDAEDREAKLAEFAAQTQRIDAARILFAEAEVELAGDVRLPAVGLPAVEMGEIE